MDTSKFSYPHQFRSAPGRKWPAWHIIASKHVLPEIEILPKGWFSMEVIIVDGLEDSTLHLGCLCIIDFQTADKDQQLHSSRAPTLGFFSMFDRLPRGQETSSYHHEYEIGGHQYHGWAFTLGLADTIQSKECCYCKQLELHFHH